MKLTEKRIALILILCLITGITLTKLTGFWQTESSKIPSVIKEGSFAGMANPADIRGSYSFSDVSGDFNIPEEVLLQAFQMTKYSASEANLKDLETLYAASPEEIRRASMQYFVTL